VSAPHHSKQLSALDAILQRVRKISDDDYKRLEVTYGATSAAFLARMEYGRALEQVPRPHRLEHFGRKICSQSDEDGIIEEIFRRIGITPDTGKFIEFGAANGIDSSNTLYLLYRGFAGLWIECSESHVRFIQECFQRVLATGQLQVVQSFVTAENINELLLQAVEHSDVALMSIDVDGNDFWIWKAIESITPAVVVIEYNAKFPPPLALVQEYRPDFAWTGTDYFGASLEALARLGRQKGYQLVCCNITGVNAFFVREDLLGEQFPYCLSALDLYHPFRMDLIFGYFAHTGHIADFGAYVHIDP
jgi:hypothetical protein